MLDTSDARRRWVGVICLGAALGMLTLGLTVLRPFLIGGWFFGYWALCFLSTVAAMVVALLDIRALRMKTHREHFQLLEKTLNEVDQASQRKERDHSKPANGRVARHPRRPRRRR